MRQVLRVYKSGVRTWFVNYRRKEDHRRRWMKLGSYPGVSLQQARELAEIEIGRAAGGGDPEKREALIRWGERIEGILQSMGSSARAGTEQERVAAG
jgi:hypothetical protein